MNSLEFLEVLSAVHRRIREVDTLARTIKEPDFDPDLRQMVQSSTGSLAQLLHPQNGSQQWDQLRQTCLAQQHITALGFFSQTARQYRPLRIVPHELRNEAIKKISEVIQEARSDDSLNEWMRVPLVEGLERVSLILQFFEFFGHDAAISELFLAHQKFAVFATSAPERPKQALSLWNALTVLSLVANLFLLPDQTATALDRYKGWYSSITNIVLTEVAEPRTPPEQRLLPPPAALVPENEGINADVADGAKE